MAILLWHLLYFLNKSTVTIVKPVLNGQPVPRGGGGYSHTLPIRICAAQWGRDFEAPDSEQGIYFRGVF